MSKEVAKTETTEIAMFQNQNAMSVNEAQLVDIFDIGAEQMEDTDVRFLNFETENLMNVTLECYLRSKIEMEIKGVEKEFVELFVKTPEGVYMKFLCGQHRIVSVFDTMNKFGYGVRAQITWLGKKAIANNRSVNDFKVRACPVEKK